MKLNVLLCCIVLPLYTLLAERPDWVSNNGRSLQYPDSLNITGYGFSQITREVDRMQALRIAAEYARKNLVEKVRVQINTVTTQHTEEAGDQYSSMYSSATQSTSSMELQGLESESYCDERENIQYVLVHTNRSSILSLYKEKIKRLKQEINDKRNEAEVFLKQRKNTQALDAYVACLPLSRQLEEAQTIKSFLKLSNAITELQSEADNNELTLSKIRESIAKLVQRPINSIDDLGWYLSYLFKEQIDQRKEQAKISVVVSPLSFEDTKLGSSFSRYFKQLFENMLMEVGKVEVVQQEGGISASVNDKQRGPGAEYIVSGSYWEQGKNIKFIVNLRRISDGKIVASGEVVVDSTVITSSGKSIKPENYQQSLIDQKIFAKNEIAGGGLTLETWTNKGVENLLFVEKDTLTVSVRVNYPCYIRFIYHMADGKRVLLLDNYYMDQTKINTAYQIPDEFVCSEPFGGEILQVLARTEKFDDLAVEQQNGYNYLKEDLAAIVVSTRGFKKAAPKMMQAEQRLQITTMKE